MSISGCGRQHHLFLPCTSYLALMLLPQVQQGVVITLRRQQLTMVLAQRLAFQRNTAHGKCLNSQLEAILRQNQSYDACCYPIFCGGTYPCRRISGYATTLKLIIKHKEFDLLQGCDRDPLRARHGRPARNEQQGSPAASQRHAEPKSSMRDGSKPSSHSTTPALDFDMQPRIILR
eukprot:1073355-Pleurochrysis_carterae.AAC.1